MGHVLQVAAAAAVSMNAGRSTALAAGGDDAFSARLDGLAAGTEYPRLDLLAGQGATDEPGAPAFEGDAATVTGQAFDGELLLLADRDLRRTAAAAGLKAQVGAASGHQCAGSS